MAIPQIHQPRDLNQFHTLLRQALAAFKRNHIGKPDHEVVMRYLEVIPSEMTVHLEDVATSWWGGVTHLGGFLYILVVCLQILVAVLHMLTDDWWLMTDQS